MAVLVDAHIHLYEDGRNGGHDRLLLEMTSAGVEKALLIAVPGIATNTFTLDTCEECQDRLSSLVFPEFGKEDFLPRLAKHLARDGCSGVKIHPRMQNISPIDSKVYKAVEIAEKAAVPVLFDAFLYGRELDSPGLSLAGIHRIAADFPQVRVGIAHAGGHRLMEAMIIAKSNPNVYLDISFILKYFEGFTLMRDVPHMIRKVGSDRVIYGSDYPSYTMEEYADAALEAVGSLSDQDRRKVFGETAKKIYQL